MDLCTFQKIGLKNLDTFRMTTKMKTIDFTYEKMQIGIGIPNGRTHGDT